MRVKNLLSRFKLYSDYCKGKIHNVYFETNNNLYEDSDDTTIYHKQRLIFVLII